MTHPFKVGDRVWCDPAYDDWCAGKYGTVVKTSDGIVCVEFEDHDACGHSGPFGDGRESCWNFAGSIDLTLIHKLPPAPENEGDDTPDDEIVSGVHAEDYALAEVLTMFRAFNEAFRDEVLTVLNDRSRF